MPGRVPEPYTEHTKGLVTKKIRDANTTSLSPPSGFTSIGTAFIHDETSYAFDEQGRATTTTAPSGRVSLVYHTVLKDRRLVSLSYPKYVSGSGTYYGPVAYTVRNHAGKVEVQGVIAFSGGSTTTAQSSHIDETDDDPITAVDTGSVAQMRTYHYDEAGTQLEEERAYFSIPASEPGTDGTHYDPTTYGYDDMGRRWRTKEAHGTITRVVYDALGRQTSRWIGTCDSTFSGGEAGTDNMVATEATVYDGGSAGGNSLVTTRTLFVEDTTTRQRQTTYDHDLRGNVVLATNPQAPHLFYKLDNMDRVIAVGGFSSTASITVGDRRPDHGDDQPRQPEPDLLRRAGAGVEGAAPQDRRQRRQRRRQPADALVVRPLRSAGQARRLAAGEDALRPARPADAPLHAGRGQRLGLRRRGRRGGRHRAGRGPDDLRGAARS